MKKKFLTALVFAVMALSLTSCAGSETTSAGRPQASGQAGGSKSDNSPSKPDNTPETPEEPTGPAADESDFEVSEVDGGVEITYIGAGGDVVIPSRMGGKPVVALAEYAFDGCEALGHVTIPNTVTTIGHAAFRNSGLTGVTIPDSVTELASLAFKGCDKLTSIKLPKGITAIGDDMFHENRSLVSVTLPDGLTSIGTNAFAICLSLEEITIPDSVTSIDASVFWDCRKIKATYKGKTYDYDGINDLYKAINE